MLVIIWGGGNKLKSLREFPENGIYLPPTIRDGKVIFPNLYFDSQIGKQHIFNTNNKGQKKLNRFSDPILN